MTTSEPMSAARLAEINSLTADVVAGRIRVRFDEETGWLAILDARREVERLLADNERLRAREAALVELAEMVDACEVLWASVESPFDRRARMRVLANWSNPDRAVESIQKQARALLASADEAK